MSEAYVIRFKNGGYRGKGHAIGQPLYMADMFATYEDAEEYRMELADYWDMMRTAETVKVVTAG